MTSLLVAPLITILLTAACVVWINDRHWRRRYQRLLKALQQQKDRIEQAREDSIHERSRILNALNDALLLIDPNERIQFANTAAHALLHAKELKGRTLREALFDPRMIGVLSECFKQGKPVRSRLLLPQQSSPLWDQETRGTTAWLVDADRISDKDSATELTRIIIRDVTEEYQTEQIRKDFVANASHELRTPMAIIHGYLENLLDEGMMEDTATARRFLEVMRKHSERISRIIEDMLMISKLESGESTRLSPTDFSLRSCIDDVIERLESLIAVNQATVKLNLHNESLTLHGDRFYWTQTLFNLVENALKQNPHPGLSIEIGSAEVGNEIQIWVSDNGVGIPSTDLPYIFRRFYRVDKQHSQREIKGTGLGLSIVKRAIEAHGGTISAQSQPGQKTTFLIKLPKNEGSPSEI